MALRSVRSRLEPWLLLNRIWKAWNDLAPPDPLAVLMENLRLGKGLYQYARF